ncbi:MAG: hypothetical protein WKF75_18005 [Singulisphaera sp.]
MHFYRSVSMAEPIGKAREAAAMKAIHEDRQPIRIAMMFLSAVLHPALHPPWNADTGVR